MSRQRKRLRDPWTTVDYVVVAILLIFVTILGFVTDAEANELKVANSADRTTWCCINGQSEPAQVLPNDGTYFTVEGDVYVFVNPSVALQRVEFYIRTSDGTFPVDPEQVENSAPWDYKGGTTAVANPWQTYFTPNGLYEIRANLFTTDGGILSISGGIGIVNDGAPEPIDPNPEVYNTSVTLSWTAPTENMDGSPIPPPPDPSALAGFKLYWGTVPGNYQWVEDIPDPLATSYVLEGLAPGTYTFVGTAYNEAGVESMYSNEATKVVEIVANDVIPMSPTWR